MVLTRAQIAATLRCGDTILVKYRKRNLVARLLRWWEGDAATHELNCLGGLDLVEETIGGCMRTNLYTYLVGNCDLVVRRAHPPLRPDEAEHVKAFWLGLVGTGYGWGSIKTALVAVPLRRFVKPRYPALAGVLRALARMVLGSSLPDCSASWVMALRRVRPQVLAGYYPEEVDPGAVDRNPDLTTVARWDRPVLADP